LYQDSPGGRATDPAEELHATSPPDSLFATELPDVYQAFMEFPKVTHNGSPLSCAPPAYPEDTPAGGRRSCYPSRRRVSWSASLE